MGFRTDLPASQLAPDRCSVAGLGRIYGSDPDERLCARCRRPALSLTEGDRLCPTFAVEQDLALRKLEDR